MEKPIKLKLVAIEGDRYKLQYPNLSIPVEVNRELFFKFKESTEYFIENDPLQFPLAEPSHSRKREAGVQG